MATPQEVVRHPIMVGSPEFLADPYAHYAWLRENAPVYCGRIAYMDEQDLWMVSRYADCRALLTDERFQRSPVIASVGQRFVHAVQPMQVSMM